MPAAKHVNSLRHRLTVALSEPGKRRDAIREIKQALAANGGSLRHTAVALGVHEQTIYRLVERAGLVDYARLLREAAGGSGPRAGREAK